VTPVGPMGSAAVFDKSERTDGTLSCSDLSFDPERNLCSARAAKKAPRKGKPLNGPAGELRLSEAVAWVGGFRMAGRAVKAEKPDTRTAVLEAAKKVVLQSGYSKLSTRDVAAAAGAPVSQIHYHFGSKQGMVLALFEYLNAQLLDRQGLLFDDVTLKVSEQWDRACDYLDEDIASGYVRILQELIAASWADPAIGKVVRAGLLGWSDAVRSLAWRAERELRGLGPFSSEELGVLIGSAFLGAESTYLLGLEKRGVPARQSLRRIGDLILMKEGDSSNR
jgi:AcrR family transcriptional regulator